MVPDVLKNMYAEEQQFKDAEAAKTTFRFINNLNIL